MHKLSHNSYCMCSSKSCYMLTSVWFRVPRHSGHTGSGLWYLRGASTHWEIGRSLLKPNLENTEDGAVSLYLLRLVAKKLLTEALVWTGHCPSGQTALQPPFQASSGGNSSWTCGGPWWHNRSRFLALTGAKCSYMELESLKNAKPSASSSRPNPSPSTELETP